MKIKIDKTRATGSIWTWFDIKHKNIQGIEEYTCLIQDDSGEKTYYKFLPYGCSDSFNPIEDII